MPYRLALALAMLLCHLHNIVLLLDSSTDGIPFVSIWV
jgi:hypothetical protein